MTIAAARPLGPEPTTTASSGGMKKPGLILVWAKHEC
jgi:hypothetical protein